MAMLVYWSVGCCKNSVTVDSMKVHKRAPTKTVIFVFSKTVNQGLGKFANSTDSGVTN